MPNRTRPVWPNTAHTDPPCGHPYRAIFWLLGCHPRVAILVQLNPPRSTVDPG